MQKFECDNSFILTRIEFPRSIDTIDEWKS
jgi:hypothetical protein